MNSSVANVLQLFVDEVRLLVFNSFFFNPPAKNSKDIFMMQPKEGLHFSDGGMITIENGFPRRKWFQLHPFDGVHLVVPDVDCKDDLGSWFRFDSVDFNELVLKSSGLQRFVH